MSISYPIFPLQLPGQSFIPPVQYIRGGPSWNIKQTATWNNKKQQSINGQVLVVKYWTNPLWKWEFVYEQLFNDPSQANGAYNVPIPETDFEMLSGFYIGMQGQGNVFAYCPADSNRGGTFSFNTVQVLVANVAILGWSGGNPVTNLRLGDGLFGSGFTSTFLNTNVTVIGINPQANTITVSASTGGTHPLTSDTGTMVGGQPLLAADANNNIELTHTIGGYPNTLSLSPTSTLVTESVQLVDSSPGINVYSGGASQIFALQQPDTIMPYQGYVMSFGSAPTPPVTASFKYYYLCRFSEDTQEYDNFMAMLWSCSAVKIDQVRI